MPRLFSAWLFFDRTRPIRACSVRMRIAARLAACLALCLALALPEMALAEMPYGQTLYVPAYSSVVYGNRGRTLNVTSMLSVRNTDQNIPITLMSVRYVDENGKTVRSYLDGPRQLAPFASAQFVVDESDTSGGVGPAFIVVWRSAAAVSQPLAQGVMIGTMSSQGISFITEGKVVGGPRP